MCACTADSTRSTTTTIAPIRRATRSEGAAFQRCRGSGNRGLLRVGAGFGAWASGLNSIDKCLRHGTEAAASCGARARNRVRGMRAMFHRGSAAMIGACWDPAQMLERSGSVERYYPKGTATTKRTSGRSRQLSTRARARPPPRVRPRAASSGRVLLLPAAVRRQRLQAAQPVSSMDGEGGRSGPRGVEGPSARQADRAARYARHSSRPVPSAHAVHQPGVENGRRHHRVASEVDPTIQSVRFFTLSVGMMNACGFGRKQGIRNVRSKDCPPARRRTSG